MGVPSFPIQHDFVFDRLSPEAKPNYQPYVKLTFFFKKRADISYEDFHRHWETVGSLGLYQSSVAARNLGRSGHACEKKYINQLT